jgi:uncharacterized protein (TIGR02145 family)
MRKNNINLRVLFIMLLSIVMINTQAQTGLNFQGVARTTNNVILASQAITIKLSILQGSATGTADYTETRRVTTNAQGLFTVVIGDTGAISTLGNFTTINWKNTPKFLKIEMDAAAGTNFITMGTTQFQYVAYAQFAKSVDAENIVGIVPVTLGGTGVNSLSGLKTALAIDKINNIADADKPISTKVQAALDLKSSLTDTSKYTKQTYTDSALLTKLTITGNAATATTAGNITATTNTTLTSLSNLATVGTITSGVWSGTAIDLEKGGTGANTASAARTNLGLVIGTNVQAPLVAGTDYLVPTGTAASLTNFPTFNQNTTGNATTATTAGNITATTNTTLTSLSNLATVGTITSGVWSGTAVAVEKGGTGATTASAARTNLGLVIGTNVQAPLVAGTDYLVPTGTAASLTNFPTFNQNTTGNATTATTAGNITATANTTLTSLSNLATVGTITGGVWSGTEVAIEKGGTGLTVSGTNGQILTSTNAGTLTWTTPTTPTAAVFLPTVVIGTQQWMEKNLDVVTYRDGTVIPYESDATRWAALTTGAWCYYDNDPLNGAIYGKLYNGYAVSNVDHGGLAPQGWHIPTGAELTTLATLLGGNAAAGGKMKTTGITRWATPNTSATNESGFAGLPGGYRDADGAFYAVGGLGHWWSATQTSSIHAYYLLLLSNYGGLISTQNEYMGVGFSVRCVRD